MALYDDLITHQARLAVVGLGYVGMPLGLAFADAGLDVIGYDLNSAKIALYRSGVDPTAEVGDQAIRETLMRFTDEEAALREARFIVVAVPTPINTDKTPNLTPVESASRAVGRQLQPGSIVVYESTVYPGVTEDICVPILEAESGLVCGRDFSVGYSPERINPGDRVNRLQTIVKIVSGFNRETLDQISRVYELIITAGVYRAESIRVAEAAKVVENSQRDINIAFMNELAMVFDRMGIDTNQVINAMNTKWNALGFKPGLVGGHCIGVDPYYFVYEAENLGYHSQIILAGRRINDGMSVFVADAAIREMVLAGLAPREASVAVLGLTFKENCPDIRNSRVADVIRRLQEYGIRPQVTDPLADPDEVRTTYGIELVPFEELCGLDCVILAVGHQAYAELDYQDLARLFSGRDPAHSVLIDVKGLLNPTMLAAAGYRYWRL
ncbi:MAG: nucleotide sugar dehydrogenase [Bacillota bacterium]|nr:nucleotide sugar dehydrogenase [Bacillota bacterium]